jgi:hypothetical protein
VTIGVLLQLVVVSLAVSPDIRMPEPTRRPAPTTQPRGAASDAAPSRLVKRVEDYWERRELKDLRGAYPFYCEEYKSRVPPDDFVRMTRLVRFDLRDIRVIKVDGDGDRRQVGIAFRFVAPMVGDGLLEGRATDVWKLGRDGRWCKEDEPIELPFLPDSRPPSKPH